MEFGKTLCLLSILIMTAGCAWSLEDEEAVPEETASSPPVREGCRTFQNAELQGVHGGLRSVLGPDGRIIWSVETAFLSDGQPLSSALLTTAPDLSAEGCLHTIVFDETVQSDVLLPEPSNTTTATLRDGLMTARGWWSYYDLDQPNPNAAFGIQRLGTGIAFQKNGQFVAESDLLWTGDRASYGSAVLLDEAVVYIYGCTPARFLSADCTVARVPEQQIDERSAYTYFAGGPHWTSQVDEAWPMVVGGLAISVAKDDQQRYWLAYVPPLGNTLMLRWGLSPSGPWSAPIPWFGCALPKDDSEAFCMQAELHPELNVGSGRIAVSYAVGTFGDGLSESPDQYHTRLVVLDWPE